LLIDFVRKIIALNRDDWDIRSQRFFSPENSPHDMELGNAGRVTLVCPENSVEPLKITPEMLKDWKSRVEDGTRFLDLSDLRNVPFPRGTGCEGLRQPFYSTIRLGRSVISTRSMDAEVSGRNSRPARKGWMAPFKE
jgi:hypothetical protein